jgi:hypothetical protein
MFVLVLLSYVLAHDNASSFAPLLVGRYASMDECKNAASHTTWINAHGADSSRFGFVCVQATAAPGLRPGGMPLQH